MLKLFQDLMAREIGYGVHGLDLLLIGLLAFLVGLVVRALYRRQRGGTDDS